MLNTLKAIYDKLWDWSYNAGTIVLARITALTGLITAAVAAMDWSPLWSIFGTGTSLNKEQALSIGIGLAIQGIAAEIVRRRNTVVTNSNKLVPKDITIPEVKTAKKKAD